MHDLKEDEDQRVEGGVNIQPNEEHFKSEETSDLDISILEDKPKAKGRFKRGLTKIQHRVSWGTFKMSGFLKRSIQGETPWSEMNWFQKITFIFIDAPWDFARNITTPPPAEDMWYRNFAVVFLFFGIIFTYITNEIIVLNPPTAPPFHFYIALGVAAAIGTAIYFTTHPVNPPSWILVFAIGAFLMSILWINWISNVLIDVLGLLGLVFSIPPAVLGITVLAWGNSCGDMMANIGVARRGFARMAIVCCFAGPFFNLCVGLGLSMLKTSISK